METGDESAARLRGLMWWIDRWRQSTAFTDMTLEEQGAYRNLLDEAHWRGGAVPNVERTLARACGDTEAWPRLRAAVLARFVLKADGWHNATLDEVLHQSRRRAKNQRAYRSRHAPSETPWTLGGKPVSQKMHGYVEAAVAVSQREGLDWQAMYDAATEAYLDHGEPHNRLEDLKQRAQAASRARHDLLTSDAARAKSNAFIEQCRREEAEAAERRAAKQRQSEGGGI